MLLNDLYENMYRPIKAPFAAPHTVAMYQRSIRRFSQFLHRPAELADLNDLTIGRYLGSLGGVLASASIAKERTQLLALWNFAARRRLLDSWPEVPAPVLPKKTPVAWTMDELGRLFDACARVPGFYKIIKGKKGEVVPVVPAGAWWKSLHLVAWSTGERIGALMAARFSDIRNGWITMPSEHRKGKRADLTVKLLDEAIDAVEAIRTPNRDLIWPWVYGSSYIWYVYGGILARANLPNDRFHKFHALRKTVASHLKAAGGDPTAALGHADPRTTQRYLDPRITNPQQPCDLLPPLTCLRAYPHRQTSLLRDESPGVRRGLRLWTPDEAPADNDSGYPENQPGTWKKG